MRQAYSTISFTAMLDEPYGRIPGRFGHLTDGQLIATPAARRGYGERVGLSRLTAQALLWLADDAVGLRYVPGPDPALTGLPPDTDVEGARLSYRTRSLKIISAGFTSQDPATIVILGARLLLGRARDLATAYGTFLAARDSGVAQAILDARLATAADELTVGVSLDLRIDADDHQWYSGAKFGVDDVPEWQDPSAIPVGRALADSRAFADYLAGRTLPNLVLPPLPSASGSAW